MKLKPSPCSKAPMLEEHRVALENKLGPIEYRPIAALKNYARNPRKHPEKQIVKLKASVSRWGIAIPIFVDEYDVIIAGEAVTEAARRLHFDEVPVIVARGWSPAKVQAFRLAANRLAEHANWDKDLLALEIKEIIDIGEMEVDLLGWEIGEIDVMLEPDPAGGTGTVSADLDDATVARPTNPVSRLGDLWLLGDHRLLCASALE